MAKEIDLYARQKRLAWFLVIPAVVVVLLIVAYPLVQVVYTSFFRANLDGSVEPKFVGFQNYINILSDPDWWSAVQVTLLFAFFSVSLEAIIGLGVALVANSEFKGRTLLRVALLIPWAIPTVVSSQIWRWMFNQIYGVVNVILVDLHLVSDADKVACLAAPATAALLSIRPLSQH
jgi:trehalose/maltose transport system permease protein